ncbi:unnamed protein product [marine sediment metagenome]|uniref:Uncharacterized protein n=1 Tax=marine sediment metagenome TaxID=412755 RepID=X1CE24_9ZZZZ
MITPKSITKKQAKHILKLYEQITRAEILARLGSIRNLECVEYATIKIDKENELREYLYNTSSLVELGEIWKLVKSKRRKRKKSKNSL